MKKHQHKIVILVIVVILACWGTWTYLHKNYPPKMGFNATELITVDGNKKITINDFLGKVVIVSCFQTWCSACAGETPALNRLTGNLNTDKFTIIYITDEGSDDLQSFRARLSSDKILFTFSKKSLAALGIHVYPTTFLLNKKGEVVKTKLEGYDWMQEEAAIRKLIAE